MSRLITLLAVAIMACAQQPYSTLPQNYTLAFENESVRISRVKYSPVDKLPVHSHPSIPTVYVYLTDGGPIRFIHKTPKVTIAVSYTHLRAHETRHDLVCRLLLE